MFAVEAYAVCDYSRLFSSMEFKMYIMIAGGGLIGRGLAEQLVKQNHDVVVIDIDPEVCENIYSRYGAVTINGNATDLDTLESAGIERCDVAVAVMQKDVDNMAYTLLAKHFTVSQIIVRMIDPKYEDVYRSFGVKNIARSTKLLIDQIMVNIESPELRKVISLGKIEICIYNIPDNVSCEGKTVAEVVNESGFPREVNIACVYKDSLNNFVVSHGETILSAGDRAFLCGTREDIKSAVKHLCRQ